LHNNCIRRYRLCLALRGNVFLPLSLRCKVVLSLRCKVVLAPFLPLNKCKPQNTKSKSKGVFIENATVP
jgi:hypothetical protein